MPGAVSLDPIFLEQRRRLVAARPGVYGLEQASMRWVGEGLWEVRLRFIRSTGEDDPSIPPLLANENLRFRPVADVRTAAAVEIRELRPPDSPDSMTVLLRLSGDPRVIQRDLPQWEVEVVDVPGLDPLFSGARLNLLVDDPSSLPPPAPPPAHGLPSRAPEIDYLAKDYAGFLTEMLDDLSAWVPALINDSAAAQNIAVVQLLAFAGDYLSYYQDATGTEAYLGTARRRVSVARHVQLLDYRLLEGTNSRVWVKFLVDLPGAGRCETLPAGTAVLTAAPGVSGLVISNLSQLSLATSRGARVFETLEDLTVETAMNRIALYGWGLQDFSLPAGSTAAALYGLPPCTLVPGRVLLLEEAGGPQRCHAVRVTGVRETTDPATGEAITIIDWARGDALPFPLPVTGRDPAGPQQSLSSACGHVVLADFGATLPLWVPDSGPRTWVPLPPVPEHGSYRPQLPDEGLIFRVPFDRTAMQARPAVDALLQNPEEAMPAIHLRQRTLAGQEIPWVVKRSLFESGRFAPDYVVEVEDDRAAWLLFGDGWQGQRPAPGSAMSVSYRIAFGQPSIGRNALAHVVAGASWSSWITAVENPLPAVGATLPEPTRRAALLAPHAYQTQERCVTPADYAAALAAHPDVLHTAVELRSTGSWSTAFVFVQLQDNRPLDSRLRRRLAADLAVRMIAGTDFELLDPVYLPVFAAFQVAVAPAASRETVQRALWETFGTAATLPGGGSGFFAPESFTFGRLLYLSRMVETAMAVPGVAEVVPLRFTTWGQPPGRQLAAGVIVPGPEQIVLLRNDPNRPGDGMLHFEMTGGR